MASFEYTKTSPSDSSDSNVHIDYFSQRSWSEEVLGSFGHGQPPPPTYKIPRKQVNSSLIHTPSNPQRSRQVSIAQSVSNGGRSSVQWNYQNGGLAVQYEDEGGANQERNAVTPVSPREGMEINFETAFRFSGLGRGNGAKRSGGSSVEVRVGDISRTTSAGTVRQFVIRKQSAVDRGERGIGPEFRIADSSVPTVPAGNLSSNMGSPVNDISIPRTLNISAPAEAHTSGLLTPSHKPLVQPKYDNHIDAIQPLFSQTAQMQGNSEAIYSSPIESHGGKMSGIERPIHSPYIHYSPEPEQAPNKDGSGISPGGNGDVSKEMTWSWDQDVNNPQNWTMKKKCYNTLVVLLYSFAIVFAAAMYLPGYPALALEFQVSPTTTVSGFTLFILGLAFGPLLGVVLGDTYGRRAIYGLALPLSSLFTMGAGLANNVGAVVACRFFAAILASPAVATGWFVVADIWSLEKTNLPTMFYMYTMCGGPCLGPLIGGFAVQYGNWPWTMWVTLMVSGVIYMLSYFLSETHKTQILYQRDQLLRKTEELPSPPPSAGLQGAISDIRRSASRRLRKPRAPSALKQNRKVVLKTGFQVTIMHAAKMLVIEPLVTLISLYVGFVFGCLFQTLVSVPLVFGVVYKLDAIESGFTILGIAGGMFLSLLVLVVLDLTIHRRAQRRIMTWLGGRLAPEERLSLALIGSIMFPISLFWWAWGARENVHWFLPILGGITVGFAGFSIILGMTLYLHETYSGDTFVSAISAATTIQCLLGALFPLFTIPLYKSLSIGWAGSVMAFLSLIFVPVPWVIWRWGRNLRGRSSFGVNVFCERERR